eukprot:767959-Hanusia_phi.AAC.1
MKESGARERGGVETRRKSRDGKGDRCKGRSGDSTSALTRHCHSCRRSSCCLSLVFFRCPTSPSTERNKSEGDGRERRGNERREEYRRWASARGEEEGDDDGSWEVAGSRTHHSHVRLSAIVDDGADPVI